jgi:hypothetical protein
MVAEDLLKFMQQWMQHIEKDKETGSAENAKNGSFSAFTSGPEIPVSDQHASLVALLTEQSVEFTRFAQQVISYLELHGRQAELSALINVFHDHLRRLTQEWILNRWQLPEQLGALFKTHSFQDDLLLDNPFIHGLKSLLSTPSQIGLSHQIQSQLRQGVELLIEYEQALRDYNRLYSGINQQATSRFLEQIEHCDPPVNTLGSLHDLWVDTYEHAYSKTIATTEYRQAHGRISNAVMGLRQALQQFRNAQLRQFGIPSENQMTLIYQRLNEQRRQIRQLRRDMGDIQALREEVEHLRATLRDQISAAGTKKS